MGQWPDYELRATRHNHRFVAVIGPCTMPPGDMERLRTFGVPDQVAWRWPGSYTVMEITPQRTRVWTDLGGAWPIYVAAADDGVYWASSSLALAGLTGTKPNLDRLATWLVAPSVLLPAGPPHFEEIGLAPAGHRVTITPDNGVQMTRVWSPRPRSGRVSERLRAELSAAVSVRVDTASTPTVDLSGGYDSTALALLGQAATSADKTLIGVTVYPVGRAAGGDLDYARLAAARSGIVHRLMPLDADHVPYTGLNVLPATDEPAPSTIAYARFSGQLRWMRETLSTDCHMTGDGGDSLLCSPPIMLADLLATKCYRRGALEAIRWARLRRVSVWPLLKSAYQVAHTTHTETLRSLSQSLIADINNSAMEGDVGWYASDSVPPWATQESRTRAATAIASFPEWKQEPAIGSFAATLATEGMVEVGRSARADIQLSEAIGVPLHNPFTDSRVVDAYLSIPLAERPGPADYKPVLREALTNLFPSELAARRTKGDFNPDHYNGMRANLTELHALADGRLASSGLVDRTKLQRTLTMTAAGLPVPFSTVEPAVAAEAWLRSLDNTPGVRWVPTGNTGAGR
ncbi:hypothetical protein GCM10022254_01060 [Actinomadura meridiana]|uniref:asparagine synthase (glutamine-hydrolyzing) n=1 Tax=Actinomadura meridiana TaxID=559626 RepID=A0ABP8BRB5_9ACTN